MIALTMLTFNLILTDIGWREATRVIYLSLVSRGPRHRVVIVLQHGHSVDIGVGLLWLMIL